MAKLWRQEEAGIAKALWRSEEIRATARVKARFDGAGQVNYVLSYQLGWNSLFSKWFRAEVHYLKVHKLLECYCSKLYSLKQLVNSCARLLSQFRLSDFVQGKARQTERLYEKAENFITKWYQFEIHIQSAGRYTKKESYYKSLYKANRQISDGGKQLIFRRNDLPIYHFVV